MMSFLFNHAIKPNFLVFLRITTGFIAAMALVSIWADFSALYTPNGLVDYKLLHIQQGIPLISIQQIVAFLQHQGFMSAPSWILMIQMVYISLCLLLMVGLFTRVSGVLLLLLHGTIFTALPQFSYGFDYFCTIAIFYCVVFPVHRQYSLDRYLFHLEPSSWLSPCARVLQCHLCLVYFFSGFDKLLGHTWRNGEALWKTLHMPYFRPALSMDYQSLASIPLLTIVAGWTVIAIELLFPLLIWLPNTRRLYFYTVIGLHIAIAVCLNLYLFSAIMIAFNIAAFGFSQDP